MRSSVRMSWRDFLREPFPRTGDDGLAHLDRNCRERTLRVDRSQRRFRLRVRVAFAGIALRLPASTATLVDNDAVAHGDPSQGRRVAGRVGDPGEH